MGGALNDGSMMLMTCALGRGPVPWPNTGMRSPADDPFIPFSHGPRLSLPIVTAGDARQIAESTNARSAWSWSWASATGVRQPSCRRRPGMRPEWHP